MPSAAAGSQNRRAHFGEAVGVEPFAGGSHHRRADAQNRPLTLHPQPQVTVVEREIHAVVFERHRVVEFGGLHNLQILDADFESARDARRALVFADCARDDDRSLLRQVGDGLEEFGRQVTFEGDALDEARPVAHEQK